jgi:hypothetical protein
MWTHNFGSDSMVRVQLSRDGGRAYATIAPRVRNTHRPRAEK